ncbi:unnamed protein product [Brassica oleracea var. botrytis]|uniref:Uncharacterized protein n=1 Tax=Brassica oleracea TaxID=3712 RepID=A0A3P6BUA1_BRAOL|nr:unnamed protein product [Brassica oleracea]
MNINREEALRVKELAQGLMKNSDFTAARQLAMKANKIDPTMENMTHMTMVDQETVQKAGASSPP